METTNPELHNPDTYELPAEIAMAAMTGRAELAEMAVKRLPQRPLTLEEQAELLRFCGALIETRRNDRAKVVELQIKMRDYVRNLNGGIEGIERLADWTDSIATDDYDPQLDELFAPGGF
jgi:hypothetical protein